MAKERSLSGSTLSVRGTVDVRVPSELSGYFAGKGASVEYLRKHCGFGKSRTVQPRKQEGHEEMMG